ncbi:hypothetical protein [Amycolatopsis sp. SB7-3]|uniref:hypothetical protein n=1 Tax=Amycolatopsis sp. SB7-3 TaxID=3373438 RepID=UPI00374397BA
MRRWLVLGVFVVAGACTTSPPNQVPVPAITPTPVTTVTATPSTSVPPPVTPPKPTTSSVTKSPWRCEPGYPNCTKAQSQKYLADLEYQKCRRDPEKIWDTGTQKCRYKTSGEVQWEHFYGTLPPGTP